VLRRSVEPAAHFPGSSKVERKFSIDLIELMPGAPTTICADGLNVTAHTVVHPSGTPSLALRLVCDGKVLAYTGDTEWIDALIKVGQRADLLIAECYTFDRKVRFHLDYATLREKLPLIGAKRVILTHMSPEMLAQSASITDDYKAADDGLEITLD
jgi:ribonuclease BN (tRNA processing enzyme)